MNLTSAITDNITELISKIIDFTQTRQIILLQNINNVHTQGFIPKDLAVDEFSVLLNNAIEEHTRNQRLLFRDMEDIKFGAEGSFEVRPIIDEHSKELLKNNPDEYLKLQISKLWENSLNQKIATELMKQKQRMVSLF
jgi:flagellar basal body rod protein FlgB